MMASQTRTTTTETHAARQQGRRLYARQLATIILALALLAIPPVFVNHPIGYVPLVAYVLALAIDWAYLLVVRRGFFVDADFAECSCLRREAASMAIRLRNRSLLPVFHAEPRFYVTNPYGQTEREASTSIAVGGKSAVDVPIEVAPGHIGLYEIGMRGVTLFDPMGLLFMQIERSDSVALVSNPRPFDPRSLDLSQSAIIENKIPLRTVLSDDVDYAGTRDYEYGDPLKSIHWKLSARSPELQTRLFETSANTRTSVIMDFHAHSLDIDGLMSSTDTIVESALGIMKAYEENGREARLCYADRSGTAIRRATPTLDDMDAFVKHLPVASPEIPPELGWNILAEESAPSSGGDNIVLCCASLTDRMVEHITAARAGHKNVTVIWAVPRAFVHSFYSENSGLVNRLDSAGITCAVVSETDADRMEGDDE